MNKMHSALFGLDKYFWIISIRKILFFFRFLGPHPCHTEIPMLEGQWELQLPAYTTATATPDRSCVCDLHHSSQYGRILNLLIKARDQTCNLMDPSRVR